jgi:hypothetical protein
MYILGRVPTLFPCHSTWLCEVVDMHKRTDVLVACHIWSLLSHHISPFIVCCLHIVFGGFLHSISQFSAFE